MIRPGRIANVMGGRAVLRHRVRSIQDLEQTVARGLPKGALRSTVERALTNKADVRRVMFRLVPEATFKRRVRLSPAESERTERLARVIAAAEYAWNNQEDAREWLAKHHTELGRRSPLETAMTELGARQVEELLDRLVYGIPA
jgi:putative toxin-antitoxin system antitoxin component (TIGR02293 family)